MPTAEAAAEAPADGRAEHPAATALRRIAANFLALAATCDGQRPEAYGGAYDAVGLSARVEDAVARAVETEIGPALDAFEQRYEARLAYLESLLGAKVKES